MALSSTDGSNKKSIAVKDITLIAVLVSILFIQEELLTFIPNIQLTVFLLLLYSKKIVFIKTSIIILIHVVLDNLVMGSFNIVYIVPMFVGWMTIPTIVSLFFKKTENIIVLSLVGMFCSFLYCWMFIWPNYLVYGIKPLVYLTADIVFELIMATCSFVSIFVLYKPCSRVINKISTN